MKKVNRLLLQLNEAVTLSNSIFPHERAMAVILFDNLIEIELYRRTEYFLLFDQTTWYGGSRLIDQKSRANMIGPTGKYDRMLKHAKDISLINDDELEIIKFGHEIRNAICHRGDDDELKIDLTILLYYSLLSQKLKEWGPFGGLIAYSSSLHHQGIDFTTKTRTSRFGHNAEAYFNDALSTIFAKWNLRINLADKAAELIKNQTHDIKENLKFVQDEADAINFYDAMGKYWYLNNLFTDYYFKNRKPRNLDRILLLCLYIREHKEHLDDIADLKERQKEGRKLLKAVGRKNKGKYPYWTDLNKIEQKVKTFKGKTEHVIVKNLIEIQNKLNNLYQDTQRAAILIDSQIQHLIEIEREK